MNIKKQVNLKLQPRRYTSTLTFTLIHLMYQLIYFLCKELKKIIVSEIFSKFNNYLFSTDTATTNKLGDGIPAAHLAD